MHCYISQNSAVRTVRSSSKGRQQRMALAWEVKQLDEEGRQLKVKCQTLKVGLQYDTGKLNSVPE